MAGVPLYQDGYNAMDRRAESSAMLSVSHQADGIEAVVLQDGLALL